MEADPMYMRHCGGWNASFDPVPECARATTPLFRRTDAKGVPQPMTWKK